MKTTGILLLQLGTPDSPTTADVRRYLREFLGDRRVIEVPRWKWWLLLNGIILPFRSPQSAAKYRRIWDGKTGSPLLHITRLQTAALQQTFPDYPVRFAMQYGKPSASAVLGEMLAQGVDRLIALPMYPQYSATTTAAATDALFKALLQVRTVPAVRVVPPYYAHDGYLQALTEIIRDCESRLPHPPDHRILSFHGIPVKYCQRGDPYATHVKRTTAALVRRLGWPKGTWTQTFQSRFGRDPWLKPYTDDVLERLAKEGKRRVLAAMPGFTADCLETIDEIGLESRELFEHAGGEALYRCPCLNDHPRWIEAMRRLIEEEGQGWL